jgi:hypothetical protein
MNNLEGGCLCGAVRYEVSTEPKSLVRCHCKDCRRASGGPALAWIIMRADGFRYLSGEPKAYASSPGVTRGFCGNCGTTLTYQHESSLHIIDVTTATLDTPEALAPIKEIWVEQKVAWETLNAELPHFARGSIGAEPIN